MLSVAGKHERKIIKANITSKVKIWKKSQIKVLKLKTNYGEL